jgi:hypothetical protein
VESPERHERSAGAIGIRQLIRATGIRDVDLNHHQVRPVVELQGRDVLVFEHGVVIGGQIGCEGRESERRKERVFDGPPVRAGRLGESRKDEFGSKAAQARILKELCNVK